MKTSRKSRFRSMQFEALEPRQVLAASITASLNAAGVLNVVGSDADDQFLFQRTSGYISIGGISGSWSATNVKSIVVDLNGGNDYVSIDSLANGGTRTLSEIVKVTSGAGNERVRLLNNQDVYFSGVGHSLEVASGGTAAKLDGSNLNFTNKPVITLKSGVLTVTGTNGGDALSLRQSDGRISIVGVSNSWSASNVTSIVVNLQDGDDHVSLDSLANGGAQLLQENVTINSGAGNKTVRLANGHDVSFSGFGHTLNVAANGTATLDGVLLEFTPNPDPNPDPTPTGNWFDTHIQDAALRSLGSTLYQDSRLDRNDMLALFTSAQDNGTVDTTEFNDLKAIVTNTTLFGTFNYVWKLSSYVVSGSTANANYQGGALGNLAAGSSATQLGNLVNKWFLGLDRPATPYAYSQVSGQLFVDGPSYADVAQGALGNCGLIASLAEVAFRNPAAITSMFIVNGDGTYTVRFYNSGQAEYVTVDSYLPGGGGIYARTPNGELWAALAEKASAQINEFSWCQFGYYIPTANSYASLEGTYIYAALGHITGQSTVAFSSMTESTFATAFNQGKSIGFASNSGAPNVVGNHAYAVVGYDATTHTVTLFNPWGIGYGLTTLTWSQVQANFSYFDRTV